MSYWQSLAVFGAVVEEGSFSGAAKKLGLTQPTVSFHIENLEKSFSCPLFQRTVKGASLTVYGEILYHRTCKINAQLAETTNQIKAMIDGEAGKIEFGASTIPAEYILPGLLAEFLRRWPGVRFSMQTGDSETILAGLAAGQYPVAVVGVCPEGDYPVQPLWQDELILIAHPDTHARLGDRPTLAEVSKLPFVTRNESSSGSMRSVYAALEAGGIPARELQIVLRVGGNEALKSAVINKIGLGFISRWAVEDELATGRLRSVNVPGLTIKRQFYAACHLPLLPTCIQQFWNFLSEYSSAE